MFDINGAVDRVVSESRYHDSRAWAEHYLRAVTSDAEAVRTFGPRDGRIAY